MMIHRYHSHHLNNHQPPKARDGQRKVSPPGPSYMSEHQIADYLKDLRTNRPVRPSGSRPLQSKRAGGSTAQSNTTLPPRASSAMSSYAVSGAHPAEPAMEKESPPPRSSSVMGNYRASPSRMSYGSSAGRPLVQEPRTIPIRRNVSPPRMFSRPLSASPNTAYRENGQRRMEKEEARSLRDALQDMDLHDEIRIHNAAQDEASELVWMNQNPGMPYKNPGSPYHNPDAKPQQSPEEPNRSSTQTRGFRRSFMTTPAQRNSRHSASESSSDGQQGSPADDKSKRQNQQALGEEGSSPKKYGTFRKSFKVNFALPTDEASPKPAVGSNGTNNGTVNSESSKGIFRNPNDQIYEEPENAQLAGIDDRPGFSRSDSSGLRNKPRNALTRGPRPFPGRFSSMSFKDKLSRFDLHKPSPSQARGAEYKTNDLTTKPDSGAEVANEDAAPTKDGIEIRSNEIRAATSKKRSDRSSKLPMPTGVSDRTGRPIVSFDPNWKPTEAASPPKRDSLKDRQSASQTPPRDPAAPAAPAIQVSEAPTIQVSEAPSIPAINLPHKEPTISEIEAGTVQAPEDKKRLPDLAKAGSSRPIPSSQRPAAVSQDRWFTPYTRSGVPTARCEACTLPISGKIVTAAGSRLHPECFTCNHCHTALECVGFYQEPEAKRDERLAEARPDDEEAHITRFYCHLDFHELFSPRCKSCKTPIEGEVVVACGAEWHVGHFFCAECGDPFDSQTPFVEKDGFAWCLQCYSRRTAPKCMGCKKPVQEEVVITAIGGQWHDQCFACHECGHGFGPNGRFFVREGEPKRTAKGRIIGGPVQLAICEGCESIRLKSLSPRP